MTMTEAGPGHARPPEERGLRTVAVVDDHRFFRDLLASAVDEAEGLCCVGTAGDAESGVELCLRLRPDVLVMDVEMPGPNGLTAVRRVREALPSVAVIVLSSHQAGSTLVAAARAGAAAFVPKTGALDELLDLVRTVSPSVTMTAVGSTAAHDVDRAAHVARQLGVTARELSVLALLAQGLPDKSIATTLGISLHTCRGYIRNLYAALHVNRRIDAANKARRLHLVPDG